ncbi:PREDICTED: condensin complex subunit 1 [Cyphomyrmex costatus]|uniref:condensin complex subunit 1 n=1 Tax=Cyphomyrmex costatus TaxID=456900 RepID=UPI00085233C2|nr:PREDICTED: condensin complex subunit 1 [Cyphomyrmex costatus]
MVKKFVIPLVKDELLTSHAGQYFVEEITPLRALSQALDATRSVLQANGAHFILNHFDIFFSVIIHGSKVEPQICLRYFTRIHKAVEILVDDLEKIFDHDKDITEEEDREIYLCINNMLAYLFSWFICHIEEHIRNINESNIGKRKKATKSDIEEEWEQSRQKALELLFRWLQIPLHKMWRPPIVDNSFVMTLAQICYKILEQSRDAKQKYIRETIFEILGTLIKKYNHGITCVVRIVQLVRLYDSLAVPIATGVVHMVTECSCNGLIKEVMNEIGQSEINETDNRNTSMFLENIAISQPNLIIPILDDITDYLSSEFYTMRNCVIGILGAVVQKALTGEDLTGEQKDQRDECLDNLEEHMLDCNAYVRSKVLQIWQHLCCEGAVPLARHGKLLASTALRLEDKSANVRKQALQLLRTLLQSNPFAGKLNCVELSNSLDKEMTKLQELQTNIVSTSGRGNKQRFELWTVLQSDIKAAIKNILNTNKEHTDNVKQMDIDPNHAFEHVRQLLLNRQVTEAVTYLWNTCMTLEQVSGMENFSTAAKEEFLLSFLLKIFIESENKSSNDENANNDAQNSEQDNNNKEELRLRKRVINYLKNCLKFATELEKAIPMAEKLLFSTCAGDAVESCTFLGTAFQFGVTGAANSMREALFQVFHRDQSVRNNVAVVYKEIYLDMNNDKRSTRQIAVARANRLIELMKELKPGQSVALTLLIVTWYENGDLNSELLQVLWEKFSMKYPDTSPIDSRTALMVITMIAQAKSNIASDNLDVLMKIGLGSRAKDDLLLARDTCRMLLKIKQNSNDVEKPPLRYPNNHDMFKEILTLLIDFFTSTEENAYISFATDAINAIYHLANQPDKLMKELLLSIIEKGQFMNKETNEISDISSTVLSKLLYVIGHVAIKQLVHLDVSIYKELKRRNTLREMQGKKKKRITKNSTPDIRSKSLNMSILSNSSQRVFRNKEGSIIGEDNGEEALEGAVDDAEAEFVNDALEHEIVTGDGLLAKFVPLVLDVCQYPDKYNNENVQAAGSYALSKMMTVSSEFCEQYLRLLITILERSPYPGIRSNMLIGLSDLATKFPNQVEPWSKHIYGRLRDEDVNVRRTCVRMLSNLIMREMIRVKGQVSELALCVIDEDEQIRRDTKEFFSQLAQKGNGLYNIVPDILSRLADPQLDLEEKHFQETIKYILGLMQKEKQIDTIIDKICARFKLAATERQWRDLSYCLSLLQFSGKSIRRLIESLPLLKEKIHYKPVLTALRSIIEQTKKKADAKAVCVELEEKIQELVEAKDNEMTDDEITDSRLMPPPSGVPRNKKNIRRSRCKSTSDEDEDSSDDSEEDIDNIPIIKSKNNSEKSTNKENISHAKSIKDSGEDNSDVSRDSVTSISVKHGKRREHTKEDAKMLSNVNISPSPKRTRMNKSLRETPTRSSLRLRK